MRAGAPCVRVPLRVGNGLVMHCDAASILMHLLTLIHVRSCDTWLFVAALCSCTHWCAYCPSAILEYTPYPVDACIDHVPIVSTARWLHACLSAISLSLHVHVHVLDRSCAGLTKSKIKKLGPLWCARSLASRYALYTHARTFTSL
jgi:hypothetical protein